MLAARIPSGMTFTRWHPVSRVRWFFFEEGSIPSHSFPLYPNCNTEIIRDQNAGKNLRDNAINLITEEINSVLGMERTEVMSMEDMEVTYLNGMLSGVSCEVENQSSDALKESSPVFS